MITGSTGFIGSLLVEALISDNHEVVAITTKTLKSNNPKLSYIKSTLDEYDSLWKKIPCDIDVCVHLAWNGNTGKNKSDYAIQNSNVKNTIDLIESLNKKNIKRFIGIGTIAEKEVSKYHTMDGSRPSAGTTYGVCKLMAHMMSNIFCNKNDIKFVWCTLANVYGPGDTTNNFISTAIESIKSTNQSNFTLGNQLYDFVHVEDIIQALKLVIQNDDDTSEYYIGSGNPQKLKEYVIKIREKMGSAKELNFGVIPYNNCYLEKNDFDIGAVRKIGYTPLIDFDVGIKKYLEHLSQIREI